MELREHAAVAVFGGIFAHAATDITPKNVNKVARVAWHAADAFVKAGAEPKDTTNEVEVTFTEVSDEAFVKSLDELIAKLHGALK